MPIAAAPPASSRPFRKTRAGACARAADRRGARISRRPRRCGEVGAQPPAGPDRRRTGHGQGNHRPRDPQRQPSRQGPAAVTRLQGGRREHHRQRAVRSRERRLPGCLHRQDGQARPGRRRHAGSRRDRRLPAGNPGAARPRARDRRSPAGRTQRQLFGRRPGHRDQQPPAARRFQRGLAERIGATTVTLPPLRERSGDIPALARHLLQRLAEQTGIKPLSIGNDALAVLMRYGWPGNVRQLAGVLFRAALQCERVRSPPSISRTLRSSPATPARRTDFAPTISEARSEQVLAGAPGVTLVQRDGHLRPLKTSRRTSSGSRSATIAAA